MLEDGEVSRGTKKLSGNGVTEKRESAERAPVGASLFRDAPAALEKAKI